MKRTAILQFSVLALLSLVFMISVLLQLLEFREQQRQARAFDASALYQWINDTHVDYLHLLNGLQRLRDADPAIGEQEVKRRFEDLWTRAEAFQRRSGSGELPHPPRIRRLADDLLATLASVEPHIREMTPGDSVGFSRVWPRMASLLGPLGSLSEAARREEAAEASLIRDRNRSSYWSLLASLVGLLVSAVCVVLILVAERQRARNLAASAQQAREDADWSRAKLEQTIEAVPEGLALFDAQDRLMLANRRYVELYRRRRRPFRIDTPYEDIFRGALRDGTGPAGEEALAKRLAYHAAPSGSLEMETGDGRWLLVTERRTPEGETIGVETDISRIKEREALLHRLVEENARFATAIDAASSAIAIIDATRPGWPIIFVNPAFAAMTGYAAEQCLEESLALTFGPQTDREAVSALDRAIEEARDAQLEILLRRRNGTTYWADLTISPIGDADGRVTHFVTIHTDVSIRKESERELRAAKEAAESANRSKSEFLAVLSHEVRTPLNSVLGTLSILSERPLAPDLARLVAGAGEAGRGLVSILNDILDTAKLEAGKLELETTTFDLRGLLDGVASLLESRCRGKGLAFRSSIPTALSRSVSGDPTRLRQVLLNLADNAVKFTDGGSISLAAAPAELREKSDSVRIEVADTGSGMTEEQVSRLFQSFAQADASVARRYGGTGLGLAICHQLVENGEDAVEATSDGGYDVVLMDVSMPGMDGFEATRRIRALGGTGATVPILALTGYVSPADVERCLKAGMDGCLAKPIDRHVLSAALANLDAAGR